MQIEDAHTHFFSRTFFESLAKLSPRKEKEEVGTLLADLSVKTGLAVPAGDVASHTRRWLAALDAHGVARAVTFASLPDEAPSVAEAARHAGGRLIPYTIVDPTREGAADFVRRALHELDFRGLLLFPAMHHFRASDPACAPLFELAQAQRAPVIVHCGMLQVKLRDLLGLPRPFDLSYADPLHVIPAANRFREVRFVLPHFGGGFLREALMAGAMCENVLLDTSSSNDWLRTQPGGLSLAGVFRSALDVFGAQRILFGTDSSTFPRGWRADVRDSQLAALATAGAGEAEIEAIMGGNLRRLLPPQPA